jgi:hypothetical protein
MLPTGRGIEFAGLDRIFRFKLLHCCLQIVEFFVGAVLQIDKTVACRFGADVAFFIIFESVFLDVFFRVIDVFQLIDKKIVQGRHFRILRHSPSAQRRMPGCGWA